jgi:UDP-N-acetylglucosamine/UDP-N-acetylgalactosamine diphosphorylase
MGVAIKFAKTFTESAAFKKLQAEQTQIFEFWDQATLDERAAMVEQLATLPDWTQLRKAFDAAMAADAQAHDLKLEPLDELRDVIEPAKESELWKRWYALGMQALSKCECAVVTLAGGQGTRLGSSRPKGCYSIGLPSGASLFELQAKRIRRLGELTNSRIRWYVMTSQPTHQDTVSFFREHAFFGLDDSQVVFFQQGLLPAFTNDGDLILQNRNSLAVAPDGNGGIYRALEKEGILADMELHGVKFVHMYCVDNCLVKVGDPVFIGACIELQSVLRSWRQLSLWEFSVAVAVMERLLLRSIVKLTLKWPKAAMSVAICYTELRILRIITLRLTF